MLTPQRPIQISPLRILKSNPEGKQTQKDVSTWLALVLSEIILNVCECHLHAGRICLNVDHDYRNNESMESYRAGPYLMRLDARL